jgi:hypothetical protein
MRIYSKFEEFEEDMNTLFSNWIKFRGEGNKMYKYC